MNKKLMTVLFLAFKAMKGFNPSRYSRSMVDLARLKASLMYVKSIETARLLFVSILGIGICLTLLSSALLLFHVTLFLYAPWTAEVKLWVGLAFAAVYLGIAIKAFSYVFSETQWLKIFHAEDLAGDPAGKYTEDFDRTKRTYKESGSPN
jgi:hypothetical protein